MASPAEVQRDDLRGDNLMIVVQHTLVSHTKQSLTEQEQRMKQAAWEWFATLPAAELEQVRVCGPRAAAEAISGCGELEGAGRWVPAEGEGRSVFVCRTQPPPSRARAHWRSLRVSTSPYLTRALSFSSPAQMFTIVDKPWTEFVLRLAKVEAFHKKHGEGIFIDPEAWESKDSALLSGSAASSSASSSASAEAPRPQRRPPSG